MSNSLTVDNCIPPEVKNIKLPSQTILNTEETILTNLTLNANHDVRKIYLSADITFIFVNFTPNAVPSDYLTFRFYRETSLIFEKQIYCSNHVILSDGPSLVYVYEPTEANFFCLDIPPLTLCDCNKEVIYTLTVQSNILAL